MEISMTAAICLNNPRCQQWPQQYFLHHFGLGSTSFSYKPGSTNIFHTPHTLKIFNTGTTKCNLSCFQDSHVEGASLSENLFHQHLSRSYQLLMLLFMFLYQGFCLLNHLQAANICMYSMAALETQKISLSRIIFLVFLEITVLFFKKKIFQLKPKESFFPLLPSLPSDPKLRENLKAGTISMKNTLADT